MKVLDHILGMRKSGRKMLAVLLDPEKFDADCGLDLELADMVFVGGSTGSVSPGLIDKIRSVTTRPIVLFPGNVQQFCDKADAILFFSVLSSRNPDLLIGRQMEAAEPIYRSGIESIPMGYVLIDGGISTSVVCASHSDPIPQSDIQRITITALTGQLMGQQLIYLEAGSGAKTPVSSDIIRSVRSMLHIPLIVGGGICSTHQLRAAYDAGADVVVIGNWLEQHPQDLTLFANER